MIFVFNLGISPIGHIICLFHHVVIVSYATWKKQKFGHVRTKVPLAVEARAIVCLTEVSSRKFSSFYSRLFWPVAYSGQTTVHASIVDIMEVKRYSAEQMSSSSWVRVIKFFQSRLDDIVLNLLVYQLKTEDASACLWPACSSYLFRKHWISKWRQGIVYPPISTMKRRK